MGWKCPACETPIHYDGEAPHPKRVYRCNVCRLELVLNEDNGQFIVTPLEPEPPKKPTRRS